MELVVLHAPPWQAWVVDSGTAPYALSALYPDEPRPPGPEPTLPLPHQLLVATSGDHLVLVDTGLPGSPPPVVAALRRLGRTPSEVTAVVLTHLHPDHLGGLLPGDDGGPPALPDVPVLLSDREWAWATDDDALERHRGRVADAVRAVRPLIADRVELLPDDATPYAGLRTRLAPGHTPGHLVVDLGEPPVVRYVADLVAERRQLSEPALRSGFDADDHEARLTGERVLDETAALGLRLVGAHLPPPPSSTRSVSPGHP
ncbi:MBL fold metallo-hydrolase [Lapillicoccus jejuensis]|uniref:Glyoxylase-like metal-dependent hydrolase (Beta-lactamase superfamily II) n=1 Tax=Lapillicoccus jejuensis TaxID=402171 RepID=A0A542DWH7_9MICO|nr:MBL fold metallo-hydrolase [Lapillicoccus jejuensis]TQJ07405.1 glyoxylase-like metal-dependent hydrolase (beta-lactamase superfamily II) [Lapillicoccus jejuensis]